jgi:hypothetical protein
MEALLWTVVLLLAFVVVFVLLPWHFRRSRAHLEEWAAASGYTLDEVERRPFRAGPFFWRRGKGHEVFHVVVRTVGGSPRGAYVRTGGWLLGQFSDEVAVSWDAEQA